jgi:hypothetical protein
MRDSGTFSIPYRTVALAATLVSAASLTALVLVASLHGAEPLATTAIALAIITFVVQLIVYVAQSNQAQRDNDRSQDLHAQLQAALGHLTARAEGTQATVTTMSDKLLDRALQQTGLSKLEDLPTGFTRDVARNLAELLNADPETDAAGGEVQPVHSEFLSKTWGPEEDARVMELMTHWPSNPDEIAEIKRDLEGLSDFAIYVLKKATEDEVKYRDPSALLRPSIPSAHIDSSEALYERGLLEELGMEAYGNEISALTEKGRRVARVFATADPPPAELQDLVAHVKAQATREEATAPDASAESEAD